MTAAKPLPHYLTLVDLADFYGFSRPTLIDYRRRGLIPSPAATYRGGDLWSEAHLVADRTAPRADLGAVVPIDAELGLDELQANHAYVCPVRTGVHLGWCAPSIIGLVRHGEATWYRVKSVSRFARGPVLSEPASAPTAAFTAAQYRFAAEPHADEIAVYLLYRRPLGTGPIAVSSTSTAGLRRARLLRVRTTTPNPAVGASGNWLHLDGSRNLPRFALPVLDESWPL